jgi:hypothetical protein
VFTVVRSAKEEPGCVPAASPRVRRRHFPWPTGAAIIHRPGSSRRFRKRRDAPRPAQIRQVRAGGPVEGRNNAGSSRTPFRHARRTRAIWQYWHVPALSGLLPPSPAPPGSGCPQLHQPAATGQRRRSLTSTRTSSASRRKRKSRQSPCSWQATHHPHPQPAEPVLAESDHPAGTLRRT